MSGFVWIPVHIVSVFLTDDRCYYCAVPSERLIGLYFCSLLTAVAIRTLSLVDGCSGFCDIPWGRLLRCVRCLLWTAALLLILVLMDGY